MMAQASALYTGKVTHRRMRGRAHRLSYRVFSLLLDLDEIGALDRRLKFFSHNRFNVFSFYERDHGNRSGEPLRAQVEKHMLDAGIEPDGGAILLLAMPRVLGYVFNPLSVYFCHRRSGALAAIVYQVHNTFGERHSYLIPIAEDSGGMHGGAGMPIRHHCEKRLFVSPFIDMGMTYAFNIVPPGKRLAIAISARDSDGPVLTALLSAGRVELTDEALARAFFAYPLLTLKVIAGIHWEALRLWLKGHRLLRRPAPPYTPITVAPISRAAPAACE